MRLILFLIALFPVLLTAQTLEEQLAAIELEIAELEAQQEQLRQEREAIKLQGIQRDLQEVGLPSSDYILHSALALEYSEPHEQAKWVAHIILPDIIEGSVGRTNDFRPDPLVPTGTAVEEDYFLKFLQPDSSYTYDGFGYDRGHLAPSADFRWSAKALSESYYYSNMSPQVAEFNRESWAELEAVLRDYIVRNPETQLYVVTGPVLEEGLPAIERSVNRVSVPRRFFKVALDRSGKRGIGFILPNQKVSYPLESFALSIDEVEAATGLDFFSQLPPPEQESIESKLDKAAWLPELAGGDTEPIFPPSLPPGHFNTVQARQYMKVNQEIKVCGTVVSTRYSRSGNLWLNIDKRFPNQIFSVFIRKKDLPNFSYDPQEELDGQQACFTGKVEDFSGTPTMNITGEEEVRKGIPGK